ncbi:MAG: hypothetical protein CMF52_04335 [Legionellales bacterium]|nr:hypothetical protein [Legionellales bacterium]
MQLSQIVLLTDKCSFSEYLIAYASSKGLEPIHLTEAGVQDTTLYCASHQLTRRIEIHTVDGITLSDKTILGILRLTGDFMPHQLRQADHLSKDYVKSAYIALWLHILNSTEYVINPLHHEMLCGSYFYLPRLYNKMQKFGLRTPRWRFSSVAKHVAKQYVSVKSFQRCFDVRPVIQTKHSQIYKHEGDWLFCLHVLGKLFFSNQSLKTTPSVGEQKKIQGFCSDLKLDTCEILMMYHNKQYMIYAISRQPDWQGRWQCYWPQVAQQLLEAFIPRRLPKFKSNMETFIQKKHLPMCRS